MSDFKAPNSISTGAPAIYPAGELNFSLLRLCSCTKGPASKEREGKEKGKGKEGSGGEAKGGMPPIGESGYAIGGEDGSGKGHGGYFFFSTISTPVINLNLTMFGSCDLVVTTVYY